MKKQHQKHTQPTPLKHTLTTSLYVLKDKDQLSSLKQTLTNSSHSSIHSPTPFTQAHIHQLLPLKHVLTNSFHSSTHSPTLTTQAHAH